MTVQPTRDQLREAAEGHLRFGGGGDDLANGVLALLDQLDQAEARIEAVRDVLDTWATYCQTEQTARALSSIRRALDGDQ